MKKGAVDIGSNSLRFIAADVESGKIKNIIHEERYIVRLAEGIKQTNRLSETAVDRTLEALKNVKNYIVNNGNFPVKFVATSAVREAENSLYFIREAQKIKVDIEIISPTQEAFYMFKGVSSAIDLKDRRALIFDIGGGSTEFIITQNNEILFSESYDLGVVKLCDMFDFKNSTDEKTIHNIKDIVTDKIKYIPGENFDVLIATAGTATTVAAIDMKLSDYDYKKVNNYKVSLKNLKTIISDLCSKTLQERKDITGLEPGRADLIVPGSVILKTVMEHFNFKEVVISDFGLREGLVVSA